MEILHRARKSKFGSTFQVVPSQSFKRLSLSRPHANLLIPTPPHRNDFLSSGTASEKDCLQPGNFRRISSSSSGQSETTISPFLAWVPDPWYWESWHGILYCRLEGRRELVGSISVFLFSTLLLKTITDLSFDSIDILFRSYLINLNTRWVRWAYALTSRSFRLDHYAIQTETQFFYRMLQGFS